VCVCVHHQRLHCQIKYICLFVVCFQIIFKFVVDITTKKPREVRVVFFGQCHGQYSSAHRIWGLPKTVVAWIETLWYSCIRTTHKPPMNSSNLEYSKRRTTRRRMMIKENQFGLSSLWPTCQSSPRGAHVCVMYATPHSLWHTWHMHLSNIWLPERKFFKSPTLLRLKTRFLSRWNPGKFDPKFQ